MCIIFRTTSKIRVDYDCSPSVYPVKTEPISDGDYIEITEENDGQEQVVGKVEVDFFFHKTSRNLLNQTRTYKKQVILHEL